MISRYFRLASYSLALAIVAGAWLAHRLEPGIAFPPAWVIAACVGVSLFIWQFGIPAPRVGLTSLERLPQIGLLLVLPPAVAAVICALASFLWPLVSRAYSQRSLKVAAIRAVHNASMTALMLLAAGEAYLAAGGRHPLVSLSLVDIVPLAVMAATAQLVNIVVMALFFRFDGRDVRSILRPAYVLIDLVFVPAGVLAALLYNSAAPEAFWLFAGLMIVFVLSFNGVGRALSDVESQSAPFRKLSQARRALHGARHIDELGDRILTETRALFRFDEFYLVLLNRDERTLDLRVHERRGERLPARRKPLESGLFGWVIQRASPVLVEEWAQAPPEVRERAVPTDKETGSLIAVPLVEEGTVIGLLSVQHTQPGVYSRADLHLMEQLAEQVAASIADALAFEDLEHYRQRLEERVAERTRELQQASAEKERLIAALGERSRALERESQEDALTGIANRRCFQQRLAAEIDVARTVRRPLTLAVADLDHFKIVNDRLGHSVGDEVLRRSAAVMRRLCRGTDLVARIGGEEFALILPDTIRDAAIDLCEHVRRAVESYDWAAVHPHLRVTLSIGLWEWDGRGDADSLLAAADTQLYEAKRLGRNRVAC
jgi:diguanylate cyclase (GGDEF)-like protein